MEKRKGKRVNEGKLSAFAKTKGLLVYQEF